MVDLDKNGIRIYFDCYDIYSDLSNMQVMWIYLSKIL